MHLKPIALVSLALVTLSLAPAPAAAGPGIQFCVTGVVNAANEDCSGGDVIIYNVCAGDGHEPGYNSTSICSRHTYQPNKDANCRGILVSALGLYTYYVECQGDANCYNYVDSRVEGVPIEYGCNDPTYSAVYDVFPYLP